MRKILLSGLLCFAGSLFAQAESFFPLAPGYSWQYQISYSDRPDLSSRMVLHASDTEKSGDRELVRLETIVDDSLVKSEAVAAEQHGLFCYERVSLAGKVTSFNPPRLLLPDPISVGTKWEGDEVIAGNETHLTFSVLAQEDVAVPAGTFHAFRAQCDEPWPVAMTIERWFAPGIGMVKEVRSTRAPGGRLLNRTTTALTKFSRENSSAEAGPSVLVPSSTAPPAPAFKIYIMAERDGAPVDRIAADASNIFVRWNGENLPVNSVVRFAWVVQDVGDLVEPNFVIDETRTRITTPAFGARFTLSRPKDGWASGKYRVDLYLDDELSASAAVIIRD